MKLQTFQYKSNEGWSIKTFPKMDSEQTLILVFAAPQFRENLAPIKELAEHYPKSKMIGCSTAGEISGAYILDDSLSIAIVQFENTQIEIAKTEIKASSDSFKSGKKIADQLNKEHLKAIFVLSNGLGVNGSNLVKGLNTLKDDQIVITGGLAGDGKWFKQTWILFNGTIYFDHVVAVGFYGNDIQVRHASRGGWDIFGPERRITRSTDNILYELDNQPALTLYKQYLGERADGLPATGLLYPLAIRKNPGDSKQLVRTILSVDEKNQSLTFAGDVPTGYFAQLMRANFDRLIASANEAGNRISKNISTKSNIAEKPFLLISISCVGRRLLLGERTEEETEAVLESMPVGAQQVGFYSYGEISPYTSGKCDLHNQTMTLTMISEGIT